MKAWRIWLNNTSEWSTKWTILAGENLSGQNLTDDIADCGFVSGQFYRSKKSFGNPDGTNTMLLIPDRFRIIPLSSISNIEEINEYVVEVET